MSFCCFDYLKNLHTIVTIWGRKKLVRTEHKPSGKWDYFWLWILPSLLFYFYFSFTIIYFCVVCKPRWHSIASKASWGSLSVALCKLPVLCFCYLSTWKHTHRDCYCPWYCKNPWCFSGEMKWRSHHLVFFNLISVTQSMLSKKMNSLFYLTCFEFFKYMV